MSVHDRKDPMIFKRCTLCGTVWPTREVFLADTELLLNGYQFTGMHFQNSKQGGVLLFTHVRESCGTTIAVYAHQLKEQAADLPPPAIIHEHPR
jgi:hypothetical protein